MELTPEDKQVYVAGIYSCWDSCLTILIATLYFRFVSSQWIWEALFGYILQIICVLLVWLLPESPKFLVELNRLDEAEIAMRRIAWFGGTDFDPLEFEDIDNGNRPHSTYTPVQTPQKELKSEEGDEKERQSEKDLQNNMKKYKSDSKITSMKNSDYALGKTKDYDMNTSNDMQFSPQPSDRRSSLKQSQTGRSTIRQTNKLASSGIYKGEIQAEAPPIMFYLRQRTIFVNLSVLVFCWTSTGFNSYAITYLLNQLE